MTERDKKAEENLTALHSFTEKLLSICQRVQEQGNFKEGDDFAFMILCYLYKQIDHIKSILRLNKRRDVSLIARSMIEGLLQLLWTSRDVPNRVLLWKEYVWIYDWRTIRAKDALKVQVEPEIRNTVKDNLQLLGQKYYTHKAKKCADSCKPLPDDPYRGYSDFDRSKIICTADRI